MKKIISTIILGVFAVILLLPAVASAQPQQLNECCEIKTDFKMDQLKLKGRGPCIIGKASGVCVINEVVKDMSGLTPPPEGLNLDFTCGGTAGTEVLAAYEEWGLICLVSSVNNVTNWIFYLLMVFVVVMVVIGGATYMLAAGDPEKAKKGKSIIIYGIVGLVIALLARLIPSVVKLIVGM